MRRITPDMAPAIAQRVLYEEAGDVKARLLLIDRGQELFEAGLFAAASTLIHAEVYLANRVSQAGKGVRPSYLLTRPSKNAGGRRLGGRSICGRPGAV